MATAESLADVVKHQPKIEELDFIRLASELGEQGQALSVVPGLEPLDLLDQF